MKKSRFSEAQIVAILKELGAGTTATDSDADTGFVQIPSGFGKTNTADLKRGSCSAQATRRREPPQRPHHIPTHDGSRRGPRVDVKNVFGPRSEENR